MKPATPEYHLRQAADNDLPIRVYFTRTHWMEGVINKLAWRASDRTKFYLEGPMGAAYLEPAQIGAIQIMGRFDFAWTEDGF